MRKGDESLELLYGIGVIVSFEYLYEKQLIPTHPVCKYHIPRTGD